MRKAFQHGDMNWEGPFSALVESVSELLGRPVWPDQDMDGTSDSWDAP